MIIGLCHNGVRQAGLLLYFYVVIQKYWMKRWFVWKNLGLLQQNQWVFSQICQKTVCVCVHFYVCETLSSVVAFSDLNCE